MPATRDGKLWRSQFYYKDWQGVRRKKNKRGFKTKGEADEWERNFLQQQQKNLDISFENFVEIYFADMENRLRESTIINKRYVFDLKVTPYFKHKKMCEIQTSDIRAWQNELIKKGCFGNERFIFKIQNCAHRGRTGTGEKRISGQTRSAGEIPVVILL